MKTEAPHRVPYSKAWAQRHPERYLFARMRFNAYKHHPRLSVTLSFDEFVREIGGAMPLVCPVFGIPLSFDLIPKSDGLPTIDRFDSTRPYEAGNISVISWRANIIKNMGTSAEHRRIADWMESRAPPKRGP